MLMCAMTIQRLFDTDYQPCKKNPCKNDAVCNAGDNSYTCTCKVQFSGPHCEGTLTLACLGLPLWYSEMVLFRVVLLYLLQYIRCIP